MNRARSLLFLAAIIFSATLMAQQTLPVTIPQQTYVAGQRTFNLTVPAQYTRFRVTFSRASWPAGNLFDGSLAWSDGTIASFSANGTPGKDPTRWVYETDRPVGITSLTLTWNVSQSITTAILIEGF